MSSNTNCSCEAHLFSEVFIVVIQSLQAFRLALFSWFGGSGVLFCLVCLVGLVGLVCFLFCFLKLKRVQCGWCFPLVLCFFVDCWSLEVTFSVILVSLARIWTCLVPGGSREATLSN